MAKIKKIILLALAAALSCCLLFVACKKEVETYTVSFVTNGGTQIDSQTYQKGEKMIPPSDPERDLFRFDYWCADVSLTAKYTFGNMPAADITLYAKWSPLSSKRISFETGEGSRVEPIYAYPGETVEAPVPPTRSGYRFTGWYLGGSEFTFPQAMPDRDTVLQARWELSSESVTVTFIANNKTVSTAVIDRNAAVERPVFSEEYVVSPWYDNPQMTGDAFDYDNPVTQNMTLYSSYYSSGLEISNGKVTAYEGDGGNVIVPAYFEGIPVTEVSEYAFARKNHVKTISLPESLRQIAKGAFYQAEYVETINIPEAVISIGEYAFFGCERLLKVQLPSALREIKAGLFTGCRTLTEINLPAGISVIGENAFAQCVSLKSCNLPAGVERIEENAFAGTALSSVRLPATLRYLFDGVFSGCHNLSSISVAQGNNFFAENNNNLYSKDMSELYLYLSAGKEETTFTIPAMVKRVAEGAFEGNQNLVSITVPASVEISRGMLKGMGKLESLVVAAIGDNAENAFLAYLFGSDSATAEGLSNQSLPKTLKRVTITGAISSIPSNAFYGCSYLEEVVLPDGITALGNLAFAYSGIRSFTLPDNVSLSDIDSAFEGCNRLATFELSDKNTKFVLYDGCLYSADGTTLVKVPNGKRRIEFSPDAKKIAKAAFSNSAIEEVVIPDSIEEIEKGAFQQCNLLHDISLPFLGPNAQAGDTGAANYDSETSLDYFSYIFGATKTLKVEQGSDGNEVRTVSFEDMDKIPLSLAKVTLRGSANKVPDYAFYNVSVTEFDLPETVTEIGTYAFFLNQKLKSFDLSSIKSIGDYSFFACMAMGKVVIPGTVEYLGTAAFAYTMRLKEVVIGEGIRELPSKLFECYVEQSVYLGSLVDITLPSTLETIGARAFFGAGNFNGVVSAVTVRFSGPGKLKNIGSFAFSSSGLVKVFLPATVENVGFGAFAICEKLTTVEFGNAEEGSAISVIEEAAFNSDESLTAITIHKAIQTASDIPLLAWEQFPPFMGKDRKFTFKIYVPTNAVSLYVSASGWDSYSEIIEAIGAK